MTPPLGAHESTAGGLALAFGRGEAIGCDALQIFVKNASQWKAKPLAEAEIAAFRAAHEKSPIRPLVAHAAYLINLAAPDPAILEKSSAALADELTRCAQVGVPGLVVHPGAHLGRGEETGLAAIAESLDAVYATIPDCPTTTLLEITAGQGTVLGRKLGDLEAIRRQSKEKKRLAVCLDTCHAFAAGYALDDPEGLRGLPGGDRRHRRLRRDPLRPRQRLGRRERLAQGPPRQPGRRPDRPRPLRPPARRAPLRERPDDPRDPARRRRAGPRARPRHPALTRLTAAAPRGRQPAQPPVSRTRPARAQRARAADAAKRP